MKKILMVVLLTLLLIKISYAADSVEGFKTLKIGKNFDECIKNGDLELNNKEGRSESFYDFFHHSIIHQSYVHEFNDNSWKDENLKKVGININYLSESSFGYYYKSIKRDLIKCYSVRETSVGKYYFKDIDCFTYNGNIFAITGQTSDPSPDVIDELFKLKYGEPLIIPDKEDKSRHFFSWGNNDIKLFVTYCDMYNGRCTLIYFEYVDKKIIKDLASFDIDKLIIEAKEKSKKDEEEKKQNSEKAIKDL